MGNSKHCDVCGRTDPRGRCVTFSLRREFFYEGPDRQHGSLSAGSIDLCLSCWERIAKPRQRLARRRAPFNIEDLFKV